MNNNTIYIQSNKDYLMHYGVPGMKWGHRKARPMSADRRRYLGAREQYRSSNRAAKQKMQAEKKRYKSTDEYKQARKARAKRAAKIGVAVAGTALAAYGGYKASKYLKSSEGQARIRQGKAKAEAFKYEYNKGKWERANEIVGEAKNAGDARKVRTAAKLRSKANANMISYEKKRAAINGYADAYKRSRNRAARKK